MHPLKRYLLEVEEPIQQFADRVRTSRQTLYRIFQGLQTPKPDLAKRIVAATDGDVTLNDIYKPNPNTRLTGDGLQKVYIDKHRIRKALAIVVGHLTKQDKEDLPSEKIDIAVEVVITTYAALSRVTKRDGPHRLRQAYRPVLEELYVDITGAPPPPKALDAGAELAAKIYYQALPFD